MGMEADTFKTMKYQDPNHPLIHRGIVKAVVATTTIDLGINHNNFVAVFNLMGAQAQLEAGHVFVWAYGTTPGTIVLTVAKHDVANADWDPATDSLDFSFIAIVDGSV